MNILITGASAGLGQKMAQVFRMDGGHHVIGTTHDGTATVQDESLLFFEAGQNATPIQPLVNAVADRFENELDVLINNAGTNAICPFKELTPAFVQHVMDVNFMTPVFLTQAFLPYFRKPGIVVNIISDAAWRPMRHSLAYNCSKAALDMATRQMARELTKPEDMSVIGIRPGKIAHTPMSSYIEMRVEELRGWTPEQAKKYFRENSVSGLELEPIDVALFVHHIVTSGMARQLSGSCIDLVG